MIESTPKVSIGLPVYNGEKYLRVAIDSILAQTFTDFELIISDNASTDSTETICKEYAANDSRIRYYRNDKNIGGSNNHNRVFELSKGQYFQWTADDDLWDSRFLQKSVEILDREPSIVLCFSTFKIIDENGKLISINNQIIGQSPRPSERLRELASWDHNCEANYGLIRADILHKTDLERNYSGSDRTLLCEIGLYGQFHIIPEPFFSRRQHADRSTGPDNGFLPISWYRPDLAGKEEFIAYFIHWKEFFHYLTIITRVPLALRERLSCYLYLGQWVLMHERLVLMVREALAPIKKTYLLWRKNCIGSSSPYSAAILRIVGLFKPQNPRI